MIIPACVQRLKAKAGVLLTFGLAGTLCSAATITGTVKGPDGAAFRGAFVEARNAKSHITTIVLSDTHGRYRVPDLAAGEYRVSIKSTGFRAEPRNGVILAAKQNASIDFALQKAPIRWNELSFEQASQLWPAGKGKDLLTAHCTICHEFQTRMASVPRDADGWRDRIAFMRQAMHFSFFLGTHFGDQDANDVANYLTSLFGPDSTLPKSPADMPGYQKTVRPFGADSLNIVYVEYEMPAPSRMPFSAAPDKDGNLWIPDFGVANKITRLDPKTGAMQDFSVPFTRTAGVHSAVPAPDGSVWIAEQGSNRIGKWDPATQRITEYQDPYIPGKEGTEDGGSKHTVRIDRTGKIWISGVPLAVFDPETQKFTHLGRNEYVYDAKPAANGDVWFTIPLSNKIGKVDGQTMKITEWTPPTENSHPRRLEIGPDGMIWFGEFDGGKLTRFDPKTQAFKEYKLPGPKPSPYALGIDTGGNIWYDSHYMDEIGRFDPRSGKIIEYPFPHSEIVMREFFRDAQGHLWYGSAPNNTVGYFYLVAPAFGAGAKPAAGN